MSDPLQGETTPPPRRSREYAEAVREAAEFRVDVTREPGAIRICPVGELDVATIGRVREQLEAAMAAGDGTVILDLRETTFLDSSALHLAAEAYDRAPARFAMIPGPPVVQRAFEVAGLTARMPFVDVPFVRAPGHGSSENGG